MTTRTGEPATKRESYTQYLQGRAATVRIPRMLKFIVSSTEDIPGQFLRCIFLRTPIARAGCGVREGLRALPVLD